MDSPYRPLAAVSWPPVSCILRTEQPHAGWHNGNHLVSLENQFGWIAAAEGGARYFSICRFGTFPSAMIFPCDSVFFASFLVWPRQCV